MNQEAESEGPGAQEQAPLISDDKGAGDAEVRPLARHHRQSLLSILSFIVGVCLTLALSALIGSLPGGASVTADRIIPFIRPGTDERTGQPASWFNGDCGSSAAQARSRGCVFDLVSHSWLPRHCLTDEDAADAELMYAGNGWHWGLDNLTEVSLDSVRSGEFERVWTSMDWHVVHCGYIWKRLHRALLDGRKLDSYTADFGHTKHCVGMIAGLSPDEAMNATGTRVYTKFPSCL